MVPHLGNGFYNKIKWRVTFYVIRQSISAKNENSYSYLV